jgi:basic membrane lipoprotein Med (substrate-binding protein (PBP1-ABC) superfamily)
MRIQILIAAAAAMLMGGLSHMAAAGGFTLDGKPKIAFMYDSQKNDGGWTQAVDEARQKMQKELGTDIAFVESVPNNDAAKIHAVAEKLIGRGYNVILGSAFGFSDTYKELAEKHPKVAFIDISGTTHGPNLGSVYGRSYESQYLCGYAAGLQSKSGKIGFVAPDPLGLVNWTINAYALGAQKANPNATVTVVFTGSWDDPVKERAAASALIDQGIDVLGQNIDTPTTQIVAQERGVFGTGMDRDFRQYAPKATLCSSVWVWDRYFVNELKKVFAGNWVPNPHGDFVGIAGGGTDIACCSLMSKENTDKVMAERDAIIKGKHVYAGPLADRDGKERVAAGKVIDDGDLWKMNWYVKGVITQQK